MRRGSNVQREWNQERKVRVPSWWLGLAPGRSARFWGRVENIRKESGVHRGDTSGISYIVDRLIRSGK